MEDQNPKYPPAPAYPLSQLAVPFLLEEEAIKVLIKHGCRLVEQVEECIIYFPEGTTKAEIYPRTVQSRSLIVLPDGYELLEIYDRYREAVFLAYRPE